MYEGTKHDAVTFGSQAMMVSSENVSTDKVYVVVKAVFDNLNDFRRLHPAFENLTAESMSTPIEGIPFHPGAEKYFREKGLMK